MKHKDNRDPRNWKVFVSRFPLSSRTRRSNCATTLPRRAGSIRTRTCPSALSLRPSTSRTCEWAPSTVSLAGSPEASAPCSRGRALFT
jgi:hypothetical protein